VEIELGPVERAGARGDGTSVSLLELIAYAPVSAG
jgi:hypothetical protein